MQYYRPARGRSPQLPPVNPGGRLEPVRVLLGPRDHERARELAEAQFRHSRELGWRDKSFSAKYPGGEHPVYFGELGEIAVAKTFDRLELPYVAGLKSGVTRPEDITHDFYVAGKGIGVKTEVPDWCGSTWEFARRTRYGCIYTVRTPESGYGGSHGYPDVLVHCLYFPHSSRDEVWITGYIDRATLVKSPVRQLFGKAMHCISPYKFACIDMIRLAIL
jgi:hypothetical protein